MKRPFNPSRRLFLALGALSALPLGWSIKNVLGKESNFNPTSANARLGVNVSNVTDWSAEYAFVDMFHRAREWISQRDGQEWGKGPALELDENGWIKKLEPRCSATTFANADMRLHYPNGDYTVLYDGEGELEFRNGTIVKRAPGKLIVRIDPSKGDLAINLLKTNPKNYLRNLRVILPGFETTYQQNPWHPDFLKLWSGSACIRFMDMMNTNGSDQQSWVNRPKPEDAGYTKKGVPLELLIDLANRMNTDPWFCIPHQADDDYIRQFAIMVKERLNPNLRAWVEYSNEMWNGIFDQYHYAAEQGRKLGFAKQEWDAAFRYTAHRSAAIFRIWEEVFGGHTRFVRVIGSQAASDYVSDQILSFQGVGKNTDVLAIAPYMFFAVPNEDSRFSTERVATWSLEQLFEHMHKHVLPEAIKWMTSNKKVADKYGLKLVAYEGGQHLSDYSSADGNPKVQELFLKANADKRMGELYTEYLNSWQKIGGDLFCIYNSISGWGKYGSWGLLQNQDDPASSSPKYMASIQWAIARGQAMKLKD